MTPNVINAPNLWQFIPNSQFSRPSRPIEETVRLGVINFVQKFRSSRLKDVGFLNQQILSAIPRTKLDRVIPAINWEEVALALDQYFREHFNQPQPTTTTLILCPPASDLSIVLNFWGKQHKWNLLPSPDYNEILDTPDSWFETLLPVLQEPFIIPHLEHWFLRHLRGLKLLRMLLDRVQTSPTPCILGLDTWAWSYLKYAIQIDAFPQSTIILKAFDSNMLHSFFTELSHQNYKRQIFFRETTTGKLVLKSENSDIQPQKILKFDDNFLKNLAGYTHGNPLLAWNIWRNSLRTDPDEEFLSKEEDSDVILSDKRRTLWILPWEKVGVPTVPDSLKLIDLIVLQTLLLHNGVVRDFLPNLLPFTVEEVNRTIAYLTKLGFIEAFDDRLRINRLVYPRIRDKLNGEGFLTDEI